MIELPKKSPNPAVDDEEVSLLELATVLWARKWSIALVTAVSVVGAVVYLNNATYTYTAEMKVVPVEGGNGARIGGNLAGLAAAAGLSLPGASESAPFDLYLDGLTSIEAARDLAKNKKIMLRIFASEWDGVTERWHEQTGVLKTLTDGMKSLLGLPVYAWRPPDALRLRDYLSENIKIAKSKKSGVTAVSIEHEDRAFAKELLAALSHVVDERLRARALARADASIAYLNRQLEVVQVAEYRQALAQTLSEQEKMRMMASGGLPFAADLVSGPEASARPTRPKPALVLVLGVLMGGFAGVLLAFLRQALNNALWARREQLAASGHSEEQGQSYD